MTDKEKIRAEIERRKRKNARTEYARGCNRALQEIISFIDSLPDVSETDFGKKKTPIREYVAPEDSTLGKLLKEMKDFSPQEDLGMSNEEYNNMVNELIFGKEEPIGKVWHDSNKEQPEYGSCVVAWNGSYGDILTHVAEVYPNRIWAYMDDLLNKKEGPISNDLEEATKIHTTSLVLNETIPDATVKQLREVADKSFKAGAQWQKEQTIDKACEWLESHNDYQRVLDNGAGVRFDMTQCVIDFRKTMEE